MGVGKFSQGVVSNIGDELARNNSLANLRLVGGVYIVIE